jgi:hypothetical protein
VVAGVVEPGLNKVVVVGIAVVEDILDRDMVAAAAEVVMLVEPVYTGKAIELADSGSTAAVVDMLEEDMAYLVGMVLVVVAAQDSCLALGMIVVVSYLR